jgi:putative DNA primase/helicase
MIWHHTRITMQNGLYDLINHKRIAHTPNIFTTNLLPYEYDSEAACPRWLQYLNEVFLSDMDLMKFIQEIFGYAFYKKIPTPSPCLIPLCQGCLYLI